ncbi:MAG TPA: hypothetical protein QF480_01720 [Bacteroidales bacterium]|jgi:hypothetical protein|nr:hypothetical protein [Bacteroidales bacterium]
MKRQLLNELVNNNITVDDFRHSLKDKVGLMAIDIGAGKVSVKGGSQKLNEVMTMEEFYKLSSQHQISILITND